MDTKSRPRWTYRLIAAGTLAALAAAFAASSQSYGSSKVDGIRAAVKKGTLNVTGGDAANSVALRLRAGDASVIQVDAGDNGSADFSFDRARVDAIKVKLGAAGDSARIDDSNGAFTGPATPTTIAGGRGNDSLQGGQVVAAANQVETYKGGDGDDAVDGGRGNDVAYLGGGNDTFRWDPGEGSDLLEGQDGTDTMLFNGAAIADSVVMTANGERLRFDRQPASIVMDTNDVEVVAFNALGAADSITVDDLTGTDVRQTNLDLGGADLAVDNVVVKGTDADDTINVTGNGSGADVTGLATAASVAQAESSDRLSIDTLAGTDNVTPSGVLGLQVLVDGNPV
jgi:hypothetical protein